MAWALMPRERAKILFNLNLIFPERTDHAALGREVFRQLALNGVDAMRLPVMSASQIDKLVTVVGLDHFDAAYKKGQGLIGVGGHTGCWELIPAWFVLHGYDMGVVAKSIYDNRLDELLSKLRARHGVTTFDRETGARKILMHLKHGGAVGILIDQDTRVFSVDALFFGHVARTPSGAAAIADKIGCPVLPMAIHRQPDGRHLITVLPPLPLIEEGDKRTRLAALVQQQTSKIEELVGIDITQWVWMHRRWKEKPGCLSNPSGSQYSRDAAPSESPSA